VFNYTGATGAVELLAPLAALPVIGDTLNLYRGCSKLRKSAMPRLPTCLGYSNVARFRGWPDVPGSDDISENRGAGRGRCLITSPPPANGSARRFIGALGQGDGCDCKGLISGVARDLGRCEALEPEAGVSDYGRGQFTPQRLRSGLERLFDRYPTPNPATCCC
jgi:hypothetical protein